MVCAQADETSARTRMLKLCEALGVKVARDDLTCKFHPAPKDWAPESAQWLVTDGRVSMHMSVGGKSFLLVDGNAQAKTATQPFNGASAKLRTQADVELCARQLLIRGFPEARNLVVRKVVDDKTLGFQGHPEMKGGRASVAFGAPIPGGLPCHYTPPFQLAIDRRDGSFVDLSYLGTPEKFEAPRPAISSVEAIVLARRVLSEHLAKSRSESARARNQLYSDAHVERAVQLCYAPPSPAFGQREYLRYTGLGATRPLAYIVPLGRKCTVMISAHTGNCIGGAIE